MREKVSFLSDLLSTIMGFFQSLMGILSADVQTEFSWFSTHIVGFFLSWGASFSGYGPWIPSMFAAVVGLSIGGTYLVFAFVDAGKDLVGE